MFCCKCLQPYHSSVNDRGAKDAKSPPHRAGWPTYHACACRGLYTSDARRTERKRGPLESKMFLGIFDSFSCMRCTCIILYDIKVGNNIFTPRQPMMNPNTTSVCSGGTHMMRLGPGGRRDDGTGGARWIGRSSRIYPHGDWRPSAISVSFPNWAFAVLLSAGAGTCSLPVLFPK